MAPSSCCRSSQALLAAGNLYCQYNSATLQLMTSTLFIAGAICELSGTTGALLERLHFGQSLATRLCHCLESTEESAGICLSRHDQRPAIAVSNTSVAGTAQQRLLHCNTGSADSTCPMAWGQEVTSILHQDTGSGSPTCCHALQPGSTGTQGERGSCSFLAWPSWLLVSGITLHSQTEN